MKKFVVLLTVMLSASSVFAQNVKDKMFVGANFDLGFAVPAGQVPIGVEQDVAGCYGFGAKFGYGVIDNGMIILGLGYEYRPLALKNQVGTGTLLIKQSFVVVDLGWRFLINSFYADLGLFYGIQAGTGTYEYGGDASSYGSGDINSSAGKNPFGLILGVGYLAQISDKVQIDLGLKFKPEITNQYEFGVTKLRSQVFSITAGINYFL